MDIGACSREKYWISRGLPFSAIEKSRLSSASTGRFSASVTTTGTKTTSTAVRNRWLLRPDCNIASGLSPMADASLTGALLGERWTSSEVWVCTPPLRSSNEQKTARVKIGACLTGSYIRLRDPHRGAREYSHKLVSVNWRTQPSISRVAIIPQASKHSALAALFLLSGTIKYTSG